MNKWKKKENWKRLVDEWFNKYSDDAIVRLFNMFVDFKKNKSKRSSYESILNEAKSAFNTEIYWENIVRQLFGWYGNYLKYLKKRRRELELEKIAKSSHKKADRVKKERREDVKDVLESVDEWAENHYWGKDRDVEIGWEVVFNPEYEHVPVENSEILEDERNLPSKIEELDEEKLWEKKNEWWEEKVEEKKQRKEPEQLYIPFDYED